MTRATTPAPACPGSRRVGWNPDGKEGPWSKALDGADAVINLSGENIGDRRWTPQRKAQLRDSRVLPTRSLAAAILTVEIPPAVFISASGVGYYGAAGSEPKTESSPAGDDFLAHLCEDWEQEARRAESAATRVVLLRSGVVLERAGGALTKMMMPFRLFAGGPIGSGRQYVSWIHRHDWIEMTRWIVETREASGPINASSPAPVTNRQFARALGHALRRPSLVPAPGFALKLLLGEMAGPLLLTGQRAIPARAQSLGYHFRTPISTRRSAASSANRASDARPAEGAPSDNGPTTPARIRTVHRLWRARPGRIGAGPVRRATRTPRHACGPRWQTDGVESCDADPQRAGDPLFRDRWCPTTKRQQRRRSPDTAGQLVHQLAGPLDECLVAAAVRERRLVGP